MHKILSRALNGVPTINLRPLRITRQCSLLFITFISYLHVSAQTAHENTGWFGWFNSYKISGPWAMHFDGQVRSADNWDFVRNLLLRPGITYAFKPNSTGTIGYAYIGTYSRVSSSSKSTLTEHRIWEQYIYSTAIGKASLQNRFRLEQRFIERVTEDVFSQRLRYFVRSIIPVGKQKGSFSDGLFFALQNEVFLNIQNKEKINNSLFDQNRIYGAIGYRLSPKVDLETGFMNQYVKGMNADVSNNIIQLAIYTRL
jgi:hypothetical protein